MLYTIAVIMIALWLLGLVTSYTMGGFIHILLVIAIIVVAVPEGLPLAVMITLAYSVRQMLLD